jgi:hypothetical protein
MYIVLRHKWKQEFETTDKTYFAVWLLEMRRKQQSFAITNRLSDWWSHHSITTNCHHNWVVISLRCYAPQHVLDRVSKCCKSYDDTDVCNGTVKRTLVIVAKLIPQECLHVICHYRLRVAPSSSFCFCPSFKFSLDVLKDSIVRPYIKPPT